MLGQMGQMGQQAAGAGQGAGGGSGVFGQMMQQAMQAAQSFGQQGGGSQSGGSPQGGGAPQAGGAPASVGQGPQGGGAPAQAPRDENQDDKQHDRAGTPGTARRSATTHAERPHARTGAGRRLRAPHLEADGAGPAPVETPQPPRHGGEGDLARRM